MFCRMCLGLPVSRCWKRYWRTSTAPRKSRRKSRNWGHWSLAPKIPQIVEALEGHRMTDHHRLLIRQCLRHMRTIEEMIEELDKAIAVRLMPYQQQVKLACTVPGIKPTAAASILAETGMDMSPEGPFPDCHHLASWATVCPGNNESAGKRRSGRTRPGNRWLRGTLTQTGWAGAADKTLTVGDAYGPESVMFGAASARIRDLSANMGGTATGESGSDPAAACAQSLFRFPGSSNP
jgi:transposase